MLTTNKIKNRLRANAPKLDDSELFMNDTIRQINLLPSPNSELQECLRRYNLLERLSFHLDAVRWVLLGGSGSAILGYFMFTNYEVILSSLIGFLQIL